MEKVKDSSEELEKCKTIVNTTALRFEEVKKERYQSFQVSEFIFLCFFYFFFVSISLSENFQQCFQHISATLGEIYRDLTKSSKHPLGGNAYLSLDNSEEPYLGGVRYTAMPPMKRFRYPIILFLFYSRNDCHLSFRDMEQLSGGERTMAALALLFSIHR